jgi:uncharacterized protein
MTFLTAEWRWLAMLNWEVDPALLLPRVPRGTELDSWNGKTFLSVIGFRFLNTRVMRLGIPWHCNFNEINLRFYVRRGEKRGVVFIQEIVPRWAIAKLARVAYNENYVALPMTHEINLPNVDYSAGPLRCRVRVKDAAAIPAEGSVEQFITEHYWGYAIQRDGGTVEYEVRHPPWSVWRAADARLEGGENIYDREFTSTLSRPPDCAFLADGSAVQVLTGKRIA